MNPNFDPHRIWICTNPKCEAYGRSRFREWYSGIVKKCPYCGHKTELEGEKVKA
jgi:hypothetical protein